MFFYRARLLLREQNYLEKFARAISVLSNARLQLMLLCYLNFQNEEFVNVIQGMESNAQQTNLGVREFTHAQIVILANSYSMTYFFARQK